MASSCWARLAYSVVCSSCCVLLSVPAAAEVSDSKHYWPQPRGHIGRYGTTSYAGPNNLTASLAWKWHQEDLAILPGSVLVDDQMNLYVTAMDGIRKFSHEGEILWHNYLPYAVSCNSLMGDALFGSSIDGKVFALSLSTGAELWSGKYFQLNEMDTPYTQSHTGIVIAAGERGPNKVVSSAVWGNSKVVGLNASNGHVLWEYSSDATLWNFHPIFPGDGTFVTMDVHGGVYRRKTHTGELVWHTPSPDLGFTDRSPWTDGGVIIGPGPDFTVYTCSNIDGGMANTRGALRAYGLSDGGLLWSKELQQPCISWPASDGRTVVVPIGGFPSPIPAAFAMPLPPWMPSASQLLLRLGVHLLFLYGGPRAESLYDVSMPLEVHAFDAKTGEARWRYDTIPPWKTFSSRGDQEHCLSRTWKFKDRPVCGPASWSAPTIDGDGRVYAAAMNGHLYAIRDTNKDGLIDNDTEVSILDLEAASLHAGAAFAPGMMAFASCDGLFVFKY